jgi:hypothetical protein
VARRKGSPTVTGPRTGRGAPAGAVRPALLPTHPTGPRQSSRALPSSLPTSRVPRPARIRRITRSRRAAGRLTVRRPGSRRPRRRSGRLVAASPTSRGRVAASARRRQPSERGAGARTSAPQECDREPAAAGLPRERGTAPGPVDRRRTTTPRSGDRSVRNPGAPACSFHVEPDAGGENERTRPEPGPVDERCRRQSRSMMTRRAGSRPWLRLETPS